MLPLLIAGCARSNALDRRIIEGEVLCGGEIAPRGTIRFVPIGDTKGPVTAALIRDGRYRADNRGGVPLGKHRVEIQAFRTTGKTVETPEGSAVEETVPIGAKEYGGPQSPLTVEVAAGGNGRFDFELPK